MADPCNERINFPQVISARNFSNWKEKRQNPLFGSSDTDYMTRNQCCKHIDVQQGVNQVRVSSDTHWVAAPGTAPWLAQVPTTYQAVKVVPIRPMMLMMRRWRMVGTSTDSCMMPPNMNAQSLPCTTPAAGECLRASAHVHEHRKAWVTVRRTRALDARMHLYR